MENNRYNQYVVNFKANKPLIVWAKSMITSKVDGENVVKFIDIHKTTNIEYLNMSELLYVEKTRVMVELLD